MDKTDRIFENLRSKPQSLTPITKDMFIPNYSGLRKEVVTSKITTPGNDLTILPSTGNITVVGDAGSTSRTLSTNDDLFVSGNLEVDGYIYSEGGFISYFTTSYIQGNSGFTGMFRISLVLDDGIHFVVNPTDGEGNNNFIFGIFAHTVKDFDHDTASANPTIFIHSATDPDTVNTQWLSFTHDQVDAQIKTGLGNITLTPATGGYVCLTSIKTDTGHPATAVEGMIEINTFDNKVYLYADAAWRQLATW
jgi:hypothetical protein